MNDRTLDSAIGASYSGDVAPPHLKSRIVTELGKRGLLGSPRGRRLLVAAAAGAVIAVGLAVAVGISGGGRDADERYFALILDTVSENYSQMERAAAAELAAKYEAWADRLRASGSLVESLYLASTDSTEGIEDVSGIVVVRARSRQQVEAMVADSPHVARGGVISVREVSSAEGLPVR